MYGKVFASMYDGTLVEDWQTRLVFIDMIVLCNPDGCLDMTPEALARRTNVPLEIIKNSIAKLEMPDSRSRSADDNGARIIRIDAHKDWGWQIVNHNKYKSLKDFDTIRAQTRERVRKHREIHKDVTQCNAKKRYTDTDTDTDTVTTLSGKNQKLPDPPPEDFLKELKREAVKILEFLNRKTGSAFRPVSANLSLIETRLKDGISFEDLKSIIVKKCMDWLNDPKMKSFLRPKTIFNKTNCEQYLGELKKDVPQKPIEVLPVITPEQQEESLKAMRALRESEAYKKLMGKSI